MSIRWQNGFQMQVRDNFTLRATVLEPPNLIQFDGDSYAAYAAFNNSPTNFLDYFPGNAGLRFDATTGFLPGGVSNTSTVPQISWVRQVSTLNTTLADDAVAPKVASDSSGNLYYAYTTSGTVAGQTNTGGVDIAVAKINPSGDVQWAVQSSLFNTTSNDSSPYIFTGSNGTSYAAYQTSGTVSGKTRTSTGTNADIVVFAIDASGTHLWTLQDSTFNAAQNALPSLVLDVTQTHLFLVWASNGTLAGNGPSRNNTFSTTIAKIRLSDQTVVWVKRSDGWATNTNDNLNQPCVAIDPSGNLYVAYSGGGTGTIIGGTSANNTDTIVFKTDPDGNMIWARQPTGYNTSGNDYVSGIGAVYGNHFYFTGDSGTGKISLDGVYVSKGGSAIIDRDGYSHEGYVSGTNIGLRQFATDYSSVYSIVYNQTSGLTPNTSGTESNIRTLVDSNYNVYLVYNTQGSVYQGGSNTGSTDLVVAKFDLGGQSNIAHTFINGIHSELYVSTPRAVQKYTIRAEGTTNSGWAPNTWFLVGSSNQLQWEILDYRADMSFTSNETKRFTLRAPSRPYNYYRIVVRRVGTDAGSGNRNRLRIGGVRLFTPTTVPRGTKYNMLLGPRNTSASSTNSGSSIANANDYSDSTVWQSGAAYNAMTGIATSGSTQNQGFQEYILSQGSLSPLNYLPGPSFYRADVDSSGNSYIFYQVNTAVGEQLTGGNDIIVAKYSRTGTLIWRKQNSTFNSSGNESELCLAVGPDNCVVIAYNSTGSIANITNSGSLALAKFDVDGNVMWVRKNFGTNLVGSSGFFRIDRNNDVILAFRVTSAVSGGTHAGSNDIALMKLASADGATVWLKQQTTWNTSTDETQPIVATDSTNNIYVAFATNGTVPGAGNTNSGSYDAVLTKFDSSGTLLWARQSSEWNTANSDSTVYVVVDSFDNPILGFQTGTIGQGHVIRLNPSNGAALPTMYTSTLAAFGPSTLTSLHAWYDAADPLATGTAPANGTTIDTWYDKSGNGRNASLWSGATAPVFRTSQINSLPAIAFSTSALVTGADTANYPFDVFAVFRPSTSATAMNLLGIGSLTEDNFSGINKNAANYEQGSSGGSRYFASSTNPASGITNPILFEWSGSNTNWFIRQYATTVATNTTYSWSNAPNDAFVLGLANPSAVTPNYFNGTFAEVLYYNTQLNTDQRQLVEGYLATKWGMRTNLPATHPYRNTNNITPSLTDLGALYIDRFNNYYMPTAGHANQIASYRSTGTVRHTWNWSWGSGYGANSAATVDRDGNTYQMCWARENIGNGMNINNDGSLGQIGYLKRSQLIGPNAQDTEVIASWAQYDTEESNLLTSYSVRAGSNLQSNAPTSWYLFGSPNGSSWDYIERRTGQTFNSLEEKTYALDPLPTSSYRYYRFAVDSTPISTTRVSLNQLNLFGQRTHMY